MKGVANVAFSTNSCNSLRSNAHCQDHLGLSPAAIHPIYFRSGRAESRVIYLKRMPPQLVASTSKTSSTVGFAIVIKRKLLRLFILRVARPGQYREFECEQNGFQRVSKDASS